MTGLVPLASLVEPRQRPDEISVAAPGRWRGRLADLGVLVVYLGFAFYLTSGFWVDPGRRLPLFLDGGDAMLSQWFLAHSAHAVAHLSNPFFTTALGSPRGVDIAGQASVLGLGLGLAPLSLVAGSAVTACVVMTGSMAGTALAWYWLLSRPLRLARGAALIGGLLCGFTPPLVGDAYAGHWHVSAQFLVPLIVWRVVRLAQGERPVRDGVILGVLVAVQGLIGEELLLLTALAMTVYLGAYAVQRRASARAALPALLRGGSVAVLVGAALLAVPLWYQFAGPQHFSGNAVDPLAYGHNLMDYVGLPTHTPWWSSVGRWGMGSQTLGLPVLVVLMLFGWWFRRNAVFTSACAAGAVLAVLSLGTRIAIRGHVLPVPGLWRLFGRLPVFKWAIPTRIDQIVIPAAGVALAFIVDRAVSRWAQGGRWVPATVIVAVVFALSTLTPARFPTFTAPAVPRFVTSGAWRAYVPSGRTLVTVPPPSLQSFDGMRWATASNGDIAIPGGYFITPTPDGKHTAFGPPYRWSTEAWNTVDSTGQVWQVHPGDRDRLLDDLRYWKASVVVLAPTRRHSDALAASVEELLGPPQHVDDVLLWDVRSMV